MRKIIEIIVDSGFFDSSRGSANPVASWSRAPQREECGYCRNNPCSAAVRCRKKRVEDHRFPSHVR